MKLSHDTLVNVSLFITLTIALYFVGYWLIFRLERATPLMMSVGLAALLTCWIRGKSIAGIGWNWGEHKYQWASYLIPLAVVIVSGIPLWWNGLDYTAITELAKGYNLPDLGAATTMFLHFALTATISFAMLLPSVLGEEIAWRGFLINELARDFSFRAIAVISGLLWAVWHWPMMFTGIYGVSGTPSWYQFTCFTIFIVSSSVIMTWLRLKSGSLWTGVIFHMSLNVFLQKFAGAFTAENENTMWLAGEFGALPAMVMTFFALWFWRKGVR